MSVDEPLFSIGTFYYHGAVSIVGDVANKSVENIPQCYYALESAIFVIYESRMGVRGFECLKCVIHCHGFGKAHGGSQCFSYVEVGFAERQYKLLQGNHPTDIFFLFVKDRIRRVEIIRKNVADAFLIHIYSKRRHILAAGHNGFDTAVAHHQGPLHDILFDFPDFA